ncbi:hypothetical protein EXU18_29025 [Klebsiella pneumoniae]|nr:hypothetical protein [Klebsiella quasipneumoniae]MBY0594819.1 hypothetical protein [Klebsiella sp. TFW1]MBY0605641.1 hypothetical protein [Klebsiella sp. TF21-TM]TBO61983.1 hypothetical protein EXT87_28975 [Klebsiella pneumoniae]TBO62329.1 hypothetical protein EXT85_27610 [Klebsiella quasipneumoniae subsp. similipneumoniae]
MATVTVHCPRCDSDEVYRHGLSPTQRERFRALLNKSNFC